jgi:hypothetical protein
MLEGGEDPIYIARRLIVVASEDVGMADPQGLPLVRAQRRTERIANCVDLFVLSGYGVLSSLSGHRNA